MRSRNVPDTRRPTAGKCALSALAIGCILSAGACSTQPAEPRSYFRTAETQMFVEGTPSGTVSVDNKFVGNTPVNFPLQHEQEVRQDTKSANYWQTQPGLAVFLTVLSLGLYIPFSFIPSDTETTQVPLENYRSNHFTVTVDSPGYDQWKNEVIAKGEKSLHLQADLTKHAAH